MNKISDVEEFIFADWSMAPIYNRVIRDSKSIKELDLLSESWCCKKMKMQ